MDVRAHRPAEDTEPWNVFFFPGAATMMTPSSRRVEHKKTPAVARSNSHRLLRHLRLPPLPLTPHRPHLYSNRPRPRPPRLHRTLPTSRGRWPAAASRRGAGERRYAPNYLLKETPISVSRRLSLTLLVVLVSSADGRHHRHQLPERPDGHLWRESVLRGKKQTTGVREGPIDTHTQFNTSI